MTRLTVAVLRGGPSNEYDVSLKTGATMLSALPEERYDVRDIFIDRRGVWYSRGLAMDPARALSGVDVMLNALHGAVGEDGTVQRIAERFHVPYIGSKPSAAALSLNKIRAREVLREAGIALPRAVAFSLGNDLSTTEMSELVFSQFGPPYVIKPPAEGSSAGLRVAATIIELPDIIADVMEAFGGAIVEEYVLGSEAIVGVIQDFRHEPVYALPPAEAERPEGHKILPYSLRIAGKIRHIVPSAFSHDEKRALETMAKKAHQALGLSHYSSADFIISRRGPLLLEVDAHPHVHETAAFYHMLEAVGSSMREFLEHTLELARRGA